jgi:hypothetical protein
MMNLSSPVTGLLLGGVLTVAALAMTPAVAHADDATFVAQMKAAGLMPTTPHDALAVGYTICAHITTNGVAAVAQALTNAATNSGMPPGTVGTSIAIAVDNLCPNAIPAMDAWIDKNPQYPQTEPTVSDNPPQAQTPSLGVAAQHPVPQPTLGHAEHL